MTLFRKYLLISLIIALLNAVILLVFFVPKFDHTDTPQYISTIKHLAGDKTAQIFPQRILKPMPILIGVAISPIFGADNVLIVQNVFFYFLSIILVFYLVYRLYHNEKQAFYGTVLYMGAYPIMAYGLASLTDISGWFFFLLSVFISLNLLRNPQLKTSLLAGFIAGFGMLFKENTAAAPMFFITFILIAVHLPLKDKIRHILTFGGAFLVFPIVNTIIMERIFSYSYVNWFRVGGIHPKGSSGFYIVSPLRILVEAGRVFAVGWLFILWGVLKEFKLKNKERDMVLLSFIPPSLSPFLWCYPHNRMLFIAFPFLVLLASLGILQSFKNQKVNVFIEVILLFLYLFINYLTLEFLLIFGPLIQPYLHYG